MKLFWFLVMAVVGVVLRVFFGSPHNILGFLWRDVAMGLVLFLIWLFSSNYWIDKFLGGAGPGVLLLYMFMNILVFLTGFGLFFWLGPAALSWTTALYLAAALIGIALTS